MNENNEIMLLPPSELEIMNALWEAERVFPKPILTAHLFEVSPALSRLKTTSVITLLNRLLLKGYLRIEKAERNNTYTSLVTEAEYRALACRDFVRTVYLGNRTALFAEIIAGMTPDERTGLSKLLAKKKS
ncbi:MAG: BlaI/MecI/CopY family transcriptional regulator [Clostridia bacterium]|nr:BlaI/MecI/CopY family transcriptional regulator [Clostridia bacterium]MCR4906126.1 BlaI/MecI/CopY family transcriptional regulator [Clostridiales bacterium]